MSARPTSPEAVVRQLTEEGYDVALIDGMLVVSHVPYLRRDGSVARASLLVPLHVDGNAVVAGGVAKVVGI